LCPLFQEAPDGRGAAGAGLAGDVDVEAALVHVEAEVDGPECPFLTEHSLQVRQLFGGLKFEQLGVAAPRQLFYGNLECGFGHGLPPSRLCHFPCFT